MPLSLKLSTATIIDPNPNPKLNPNNCFLISAIDFTLSAIIGKIRKQHMKIGSFLYKFGNSQI